MRFIVSGRPQVGGQNATNRAGRRWPSTGTLVEVVKQDDDPEPEPGKPTDVLRIGKKTWDVLKEDKVLIHIVPEGDAEEVAGAHAEGAKLREENGKLKARIAELEGRVAELETAQPPTPAESTAETGHHHSKKGK